MGGAISVTIAVLAVVAFAVAGSKALVIVSSIVVVACLWSWLQMWYCARLLARQRLFVAALDRGGFEQGSPEAKQYWSQMKIQVDTQDVNDVPNWIVLVNMLASAAALLLLIWGVLANWIL